MSQTHLSLCQLSNGTQRTTQLNHGFVASKIMSCKPVDNKNFVRQPSEQFKNMDRPLKMFSCVLCYKTIKSSTSLLGLTEMSQSYRSRRGHLSKVGQSWKNESIQTSMCKKNTAATIAEAEALSFINLLPEQQLHSSLPANRARIDLSRSPFAYIPWSMMSLMSPISVPLFFCENGLKYSI